MTPVEVLQALIDGKHIRHSNGDIFRLQNNYMEELALDGSWFRVIFVINWLLEKAPRCSIVPDPSEQHSGPERFTRGDIVHVDATTRDATAYDCALANLCMDRVLEYVQKNYERKK